MPLKQLPKLLSKNRKTIAVAESCTGGLLSHFLTQASGSSKYFKLGLVLYSNKSKSRILKIDKRIISRYGAVSEEIALLMAKKVKALAQTDIGLAITGFAGPRGGNRDNPVGTVYIALAHNNSTLVRKFKFSGKRSQVKNKAKNKALSLIRKCLPTR